MNFLILSAGRRTKLVEYFKKEFENTGLIIVTDCDKFAPALYTADRSYIVPQIDDHNYINHIKQICIKEDIKGLISLIDPELSLISKNEEIFRKIGVKCFLSPYDVTEICFNKYKMFKFLECNSFKRAKSYITFHEFKKAYDNHDIKLPVILKPVCGSASININKINNLEEVKLLMDNHEELMIQEFLDGQEIGVDVYIDIISGEVISIFAKEKIRMRSGETDKSKSIKCNKLFNIITEFVTKLGTRGPIDIDVFKVEDEYYISEVNPRFGGGYPHAYECGEIFIKYINNNLKNMKNTPSIGNYNDDIYMIKHDSIMMLNEEHLRKFKKLNEINEDDSINKRIYLASPHMCGKEMKYINEAFDSNWIAPLGPNVNEFEKEICKYTGSKSSTALVSGTSAIHLALKCLDVRPNDIVFCSSLTFSATVNPIIYEGAKPVFIDSNYETWNMCPLALEKAFDDAKKCGEMPKVVLVANLYGQSADYDKLKNICDKYNVPIVEDAAESLGATYKGRKSGTIGEIGIFSFNGNKIITTSGGGMMISNNEEYTQKTLFWATQSRESKRYYEHKELGYNYRMSNVLAGIGRGQLTTLNDRIAKKKEIYETYKDTFKDIEDIEMMNIAEYGNPNYWLSVATIKKKSKITPLDIILALEENNIESRYVWKPMNIQPFFEKYKFFTYLKDKSVAEDLFNRGICLPSDTKMDKNDMEKVITVIKNLFM